MTPRVMPLMSNDTQAVSTLAETIWRFHYVNILSAGQIDYMLAQRYPPQLIRKQLLDPAIWWRKLVLDNEMIGFSCYMCIKASNQLKIDKLYIHCNHHRKGYGALLMADAIGMMRKMNLQSLILTVNKYNQTAISAYQHYGFEITAESIVDIGNGFVMDDYLMTLTHFSRWKT